MAAVVAVRAEEGGRVSLAGAARDLGSGCGPCERAPADPDADADADARPAGGTSRLAVPRRDETVLQRDGSVPQRDGGHPASGRALPAVGQAPPAAG